jgi:hypothetical protein
MSCARAAGAAASNNAVEAINVANAVQRMAESARSCTQSSGRPLNAARQRRRTGIPSAGKRAISMPPTRIGAPGAGAHAIAVMVSQVAGNRPSCAACPA